MKTAPNDELQEYLTQQGISWKVIPWDRHAELEKRWQAIYTNALRLGSRHKHGHRAEFEYSQQEAADFLIVPFLGPFSGPLYMGKRYSHTTAYECHGMGKVPDLSSFRNLEFFIAPPDYAWTMIHSHEDHGCGGPYFVRKEWVAVP